MRRQMRRARNETSCFLLVDRSENESKHKQLSRQRFGSKSEPCSGLVNAILSSEVMGAYHRGTKMFFSTA